MRSQQKEEPQLSLPAICRNEPGTDQHTSGVRVRDDFFHQTVTPFGIVADHVIAKGFSFNAHHFAGEVTPFFMKKRGTVGDQELSIANLGPVDGWVINFGDDAMREGEPDTTGSSIRCPN